MNDEPIMDAEYAASVFERVGKLMAFHGVPATPINYTVWFEYVRGASPFLRKTIDVLIANRRSFDASVNRELGAYFLEGRGAEGGVPDQLADVLDDAKGLLTNAISDSDKHMTALAQVSRSIVSPDADPRSTLLRLAEELARAKARAEDLEAGLSGASRRLEIMSASLKEAEAQSNTDPLTGLANRRSMESFLRTALIKSMEVEKPLSIFIVDVDHFKGFNDRFGHQIGDQVLRLVSRALREGLRENDLACRYGGEELMAVLPGADLGTAVELADRLRARIANTTLKKRSSGEDVGAITVSIGVAEFKPGEPLEALVERSDEAMYAAKRGGRNRTCAEAAENAVTHVRRAT
jgi:diguanylate cyclase